MPKPVRLTQFSPPTKANSLPSPTALRSPSPSPKLARASRQGGLYPSATSVQAQSQSLPPPRPSMAPQASPSPPVKVLISIPTEPTTSRNPAHPVLPPFPASAPTSPPPSP